MIAFGEKDGAGIGGGRNASADGIDINSNSTVEAKGYNEEKVSGTISGGAGIGGGYNGSGTNI